MKKDCELRPNRSMLVGYVWRTGTSRTDNMSYAKQAIEATENQKEYLQFLMNRLDEHGAKYRKPSEIDSNITLNKRRWYAKVIGGLQKVCKANKIDISDWERRRPKKEVYKPYTSTAVPIKLSARKEKG